MIIKNGKVLIGGEFEAGDIEFDDKIKTIGTVSKAADIDASHCYVIPGLIDLHTHGAMGEDTSDGKKDGFDKLAKFYAKNGVTSFCATTLTLPEDKIINSIHVVKDYKRSSSSAKCAGIHLEGPFFSYEKRGAQDPDFLRNPDIAMFDRLCDEADGILRIISIAPELEGSIEFIKHASKTCTVALGHTITDYDTALAAFQNGASHVTHLFNGMNPFSHRAPGVVGAAFDSGATVELISDGMHLHPSTIRTMFEMFGSRAVLISDSIRCAGMPDGEYELGGQKFFVKDSKATLADGTIAGSSINLMAGLRNIVRFGIPLEAAVKSVTIEPAKVIGLENSIGSLEVGKCADLVVLDKDLNIVKVIIDGDIAD